MTDTLRLTRALRFSGEVRPPSDKSLTHRAFMLAGMAQGVSNINQPLFGEDCRATLQAVQVLGARAEEQPDRVVIQGEPNWSAQGHDIDCGNSGTTIRLLSGLVASFPGVNVTLSGDASLSRRPMKRIATPLRQMGADIGGDTPPLKINGKKLNGIRYESPIASAQVKSCVLLAGLRASGQTWVSEPSLSRDHTERMLQALGVDLLRDNHNAVGVQESPPWSGFDFTVPADISSAAFLLVAACLVPGGTLTLQGVGTNSTRTGILDVLEQVGAVVTHENPRDELGEPVADLALSAQPPLRPFEIGGALVPRLIDEIPVLAVLATQCEGTSVVRDAAEMRVKESDRIAEMAAGLTRMGANVKELEDGFEITGPTPLVGTTIDAKHDHRLAMSFAVAGLVAEGETVITGAESIRTSYPDFLDHLRHLTGGID